MSRDPIIVQCPVCKLKLGLVIEKGISQEKIDEGINQLKYVMECHRKKEHNIQFS